MNGEDFAKYVLENDAIKKGLAESLKKVEEQNRILEKEITILRKVSCALQCLVDLFAQHKVLEEIHLRIIDRELNNKVPQPFTVHSDTTAEELSILDIYSVAGYFKLIVSHCVDAQKIRFSR